MSRRTTNDVRYPLQPLLDQLDTPTDHDACRILRLSHTRFAELLDQGLTPWQADRYACRIGAHPAWIWPTWWTDVTNPDPDR